MPPLALPTPIAVVPYAATPFSRWTVDEVRATLDAHEAGDFAASAQLADAFGRDDRIAGCLAKRVRALTAKSGLPFDVEPADEADGRRGKTIAKTVFNLWWDVCPESVIARILRDTICLGVAVGRVLVRYEAGEYVVRLAPLPAHGLRWDAYNGVYLYETISGPMVVTPGENGWFLHTAGAHEPWLEGAVRALGLPFVMRQFTHRDWVRYCEKHGIPLLVIDEPADAPDVEKKAFLQRLRTIGSEGIVRAPKDSEGKGYDVRVVEPKGNSHEAFEKFLIRLDTSIAVYVLGQNLTTEVQGGSYAAANAHRYVANDVLTADAEPLATSLRDQVWKPWGRYNVAGWTDDLAPWPAWDTSLPEDKQAKAVTLKAAGDALASWNAALRQAKKAVDVEKYAEAFALDIVDFEPPEPPPAAALPAPMDVAGQAEQRVPVDPTGAAAQPGQAPAPPPP